jgi:hypothetical protein
MSRSDLTFDDLRNRAVGRRQSGQGAFSASNRSVRRLEFEDDVQRVDDTLADTLVTDLWVGVKWSGARTGM